VLQTLLQQVQILRRQVVVLSEQQHQELISALDQVLAVLASLDPNLVATVSDLDAPHQNTSDEEVTVALQQREDELVLLHTELAQKTQLLNMVLATIPDRCYLMDREKRFIYVNQAGLRLLGTTEATILGRTSQDLMLPPEAIEPCLAKVDEVLERGTAVSGDSQHLSPTEGLRYSSYTLTPLFSEGQHLDWVLITSRDITDRKQAELELYRREQAFRALAENSPDLIARFDQKLRHVYVNPAIALATGQSIDQIIGYTYRELGFPKASVDDWHRRLRRVFATGMVETYEFELASPFGVNFYQAILVPEVLPDRTVEFVLSISRDITRMRQQQEELQLLQNQLEQQARLLNTVLTTTPDQLYLADRDRRLIYINRAGLEFLKAQRTQQGRSLADEETLDTPNALQGFQASLDQVFSTGQALTQEVSFPTANQGLHYFQYTYSPIYASDRRVERVLITARDVTDYKITQAALQQQEASSRALLSAIPDLIFLLDTQGNYLAYHTLNDHDLTLTPEELQGKTIREIFPSDLADQIHQHIADLVNTEMMQIFHYQHAGSQSRQGYEARLTQCGRDRVLLILRDITSNPMLRPDTATASSPAVSNLTLEALSQLYQQGQRTFLNLSLPGSDLRGLTLCSIELPQANLCGSDLRGTDLQNANLQRANLRGSDLRGADLQSANLQGANLCGANLLGCNLRGADLTAAQLEGALVILNTDSP